MAQMSLIDVKNHRKPNLKHFVVQTRSFQIEKYRDVGMYPHLRYYIQKQKEKRKQEMEMSAELKRAKREKELKHNQDKLTLGEIKEEICKQEVRLLELEKEKHKLFAEFKKVLNEDDNRKNLQRQKEANSNNVITSMTFGPQPPPPSSTTQSFSVSNQPSSLASSMAPSTTPSNPNNQSPLKFPAPQTGPPPPQPPSITNPTLISNSTIFAHNPYYQIGASLPPPPGSIIGASGSSTSPYSQPPQGQQQQHRSLNPSPNSYQQQKQQQPPPISMSTIMNSNNHAQSLYSKTNGGSQIPPSLAPMLPSATLVSSASNTAALLNAVSMSSSFQALPSPNDRQREQQRALSSYKNLGPPPGPPQSTLHQSIPAYIPGYSKPPLPPQGSHGHPSGSLQAPPPPFHNLTLEQMHQIHNMPFYSPMMLPYPPANSK